MKRKNIFVIGADDFNLEQLETLRDAEHYDFHPLFGFKEIRGGDRIPAEEILNEVEKRLKAFPGSVDGIVGYQNFPVSTMLPILRGKFGLLTPSLESVLKCEHKYWSRLEQAKVIPENTPRFAAVDPFADDPLAGIEIDYPFWIKPVKAVLSHLGFRIENEKDFRESIEIIREKIGRFGEPFNYLLDFAELPEEIVKVDGYHCIAEEIISAGRQCTVEGYAFEGDIEIYGVIDSIREGPQGSSFSRYQYPSRLPQNVLARIGELAETVIRHLGYDNAPFNIEFFWDEEADRIWLLEINPRLSKSHCPLFYMVDGACHFQIMIDIALGRRPDFPYRQGYYRYAAKFMLRKYEDARVMRVPSEDEIRELKKRLPGTMVQIEVEEGMRLSELRDQDSYSYEIAVLFLGADDEEELLEKYERCLELLPLELSDQ